MQILLFKYTKTFFRQEKDICFPLQESSSFA